MRERAKKYSISSKQYGLKVKNNLENLL